MCGPLAGVDYLYGFLQPLWSHAGGGLGKCVLNEHSLIVGPVSMFCPHSGQAFPEAVVSLLRYPHFSIT